MKLSYGGASIEFTPEEAGKLAPEIIGGIFGMAIDAVKKPVDLLAHKPKTTSLCRRPSRTMPAGGHRRHPSGDPK